MLIQDSNEGELSVEVALRAAFHAHRHCRARSIARREGVFGTKS